MKLRVREVVHQHGERKVLEWTAVGQFGIMRRINRAGDAERVSDGHYRSERLDTDWYWWKER